MIVECVSTMISLFCPSSSVQMAQISIDFQKKWDISYSLKFCKHHRMISSQTFNCIILYMCTAVNLFFISLSIILTGHRFIIWNDKFLKNIETRHNRYFFFLSHSMSLSLWFIFNLINICKEIHDKSKRERGGREKNRCV